MKRKYRKVALVALACLSVFTACTKEQELKDKSQEKAVGEWIIPEVSQDYFTVLCENSDVRFNSLSCSNNVYYTVISARPLTTEDIKISFDKHVEFQYELVMEQEKEILPDYMFATYQGVSWSELANLIKEDKREEADDLLMSVTESYNEIAQSEIPPLYKGKLIIKFTDRPTETELTELTVEMEDKNYVYEIGRIIFFDEGPELSCVGLPICNTLSLIDLNVMPEKEGSFQTGYIELAAREDLEIDNIYFYDAESTRISSVEVKHTRKDGTTVDYLWYEGDKISLAEGEKALISVKGYDSLFCETLQANISRYLVIEYNYDGEQCREGVEMTFRMRRNAFEYYAMMKDGLDILPFYTEFLPVK